MVDNSWNRIKLINLFFFNQSEIQYGCYSSASFNDRRMNDNLFCMIKIKILLYDNYRSVITLYNQIWQVIQFVTSINKPLSFRGFNCISGVMLSMLVSCCGRSCVQIFGQVNPKDYNICISCFFATLRNKNKDWLAQNQDNVSEWSDMSTRGLLFQ